MTVVAMYADFKTLEVSVDPWWVDAVVESFYKTGAIMVSTKEGK